MNEEIKSRLAEVQSEAHEMLKTIKRVKGKQWGTTVQMLLLVKQSAEIASFMCHQISDMGDDTAAEKLADAMGTQLVHMGSTVHDLVDFTEEQWASIIQDVESLSGAVSNLVKTAIESPEWGSKGGRGAA